MSDWKSGAAKRRDTRATKTPDAIVNVKGKTKKTKRWCKGKVGVEHKPECMLYKSVMTHDEVNIFKDWRQLVCSLCGKRLDWWAPLPKEWRMESKKPKPAWVTM
jgi:hypothetical protein